MENQLKLAGNPSKQGWFIPLSTHYSLLQSLFLECWNQILNYKKQLFF